MYFLLDYTGLIAGRFGRGDASGDILFASSGKKYAKTPPETKASCALLDAFPAREK